MDIEQICKSWVLDFESQLEWDFPEERMGIADRQILNKVVNDAAKIYSAYLLDRDNFGATGVIRLLVGSIREEMQRYGYKTRKVDFSS